jgi:hypothetical protein
MSQLTPDECRVLGVLIEKAQTTPGQYPLTLNAVTTGANQKNNRSPVVNLSEDDALHALDGLRSKGLAREVMMTGSRVQKHRHIAREGLGVDTSELVILAELLLRGPQTVGELRGRATRMHPIESIEVVSAILAHLMEREEPYIRKCAPAPGSRAPRYAQLLCPDLHPLDAELVDTPEAARTPAVSAAAASDLLARVERLERQVAHLAESLGVSSEETGVPGD